VLVGGPVESLERMVVRTREDPPRGGPLAGLGAGIAEVSTALVGVIAADMPFALPVVAGALVRLDGLGDVRTDHPIAGPDTSAGAAAPTEGVDAVVPVDPAGWPQTLCAAYSTQALRGALAGLQPLAGRPVRALLPRLRVMEWPVPAAALADVDTEDELAVARIRAAEEATQMQEWVDAVRQALGVDVVVDIDAILDVARDAAHAVDRPAAPVTTYLLGAAVAAGADPAEASGRVEALARDWATRPR